MSNCSNCYNGCTEIISDRCVKYTGIDVPVLGIQTGDSLSYVEQALITFLTSTLDGTGVKIDLAPTVICDLVQQYLPTCKDLSIVDVSKALIEAACDLQEQVDDIVSELATLNADYTIGCLTGVTASSDTHAIVQAVINKLCSLENSFNLLAASLPLTYVKLIDLDTLIQNYLDENSNSTLISNRMVPYAVVPYFGPITFFNASGAGTGDWDKIFLCNGNNGTPDLRGRALTGVINGVPGPTLSPVVDPSIPGSGNPNYSLFTNAGANQITLDIDQMPAHTHTATVTINDPKHKHSITNYNITNGSTTSPTIGNANTTASFDTTESLTGLKGTGAGQNVFVTNASQGSNLPHANIQPVTACYYIQYRP